MDSVCYIIANAEGIVHRRGRSKYPADRNSREAVPPSTPSTPTTYHRKRPREWLQVVRGLPRGRAATAECPWIPPCLAKIVQRFVYLITHESLMDRVGK